MRIFKTREFARFARKNRISDEALREAAERARKGHIDAYLGGGLIKQRVARPGDGRRGGFRTIIAWRVRKRCVFVYGFAKNKRANISDDDQKDLKDLAKMLLAYTEPELAEAIAAEALIEVEYEDGD